MFSGDSGDSGGVFKSPDPPPPQKDLTPLAHGKFTNKKKLAKDN